MCLEFMLSPAAKERLKEAAKCLCRCTSFRDQGLSPDQWAALSYAAERYRLSGVRLVLLHVDQDVLKRISDRFDYVHGCRTAAAVVVDRFENFYEINAGITGELFRLEAAALGLGSTWVSAGRDTGTLPVKLRSGERIMMLIPLGVPLNPPPVNLDPSPYHGVREQDRIMIDVPHEYTLEAGYSAVYEELNIDYSHEWHYFNNLYHEGLWTELPPDEDEDEYD